VLLVPGLISLAIPPSLELGIDFSSGTALEITFEKPFTEAQIREVLKAEGHPEAIIQKTGDKSLFIRTEALEDLEQRNVRQRLDDAFVVVDGGYSFDYVSPIVAKETVHKTIWAAVAAAIGILAYVTWAFRNVPNPFRYGLLAIVALVHDVVIVVGMFSILGKLIGMEINVIFMVGLLTIAGYSVNDTIVVFDRIRENIARNITLDRPLEMIVNTSLLESLGRSINTSLTTMLVILALLFIGGSTIRPFLLVLALGVMVGTYSSIFLASQLLVAWDRGEIPIISRRKRKISGTG
jgi:preprotein translocase subunit SecF